MGAVAQQYGEQICRGGRGVDGPSKALCCQARQQAAVIDVRVGQQHKIDLARVKGEGSVIAVFGFGAALHHAAVDQETAAIGLYQIARPGDLLGRAQKCDLHCLATLFLLFLRIAGISGT